jgi:TonB family protein
MFLAALALFSNPALLTPVIHPAIAATAAQNRSSDYPIAPRSIPSLLTTGVKLTIGANGHVENCVVTSASPWPALDPALCRILDQMQFQPAAAANGHPVGRTFEVDMEWKPPRLW